MSVNNYRREANAIPSSLLPPPPATPLLSPPPSSTPPPYEHAFTHNNFKPSRSKQQNCNVRQFDNKNINSNCSKTADFDTESDAVKLHAKKKHVRKKKHFKSLTNKNKSFALENFNKTFQEKPDLKNKLVSGMAVQELYKDFQSSRNNANNCNSSKDKLANMNLPTAGWKNNNNNHNHNDSTSPCNTKTSKQRHKHLGGLDWNRRRHSEDLKNVDDSDSSYFERKSTKDVNQTGNNQGSDSEYSIEDTSHSQIEEEEEEEEENDKMEDKLKIASAALLMGKYSKRKDFPLDDLTYVQGSKRVLQFLHTLWLEQTTCDVTIICDGGDVLSHQVGSMLIRFNQI